MNGSIRKIIAIAALVGVAVIAGGADVSAQIRTGMFGGINFNMTSASLQNFIPGVGGGLFASNDFSDATSVGGYAGAIGEYGIDDRLGLSLRVSYDQRNAEKESNGNMLRARFAYVAIEPGLGFRVGYTPLKLTVGPVMAVKVASTYTYASASAEPGQDITNAKLANARQVVFGGRLALGYDIALNKENSTAGVYLTPFVEGNYLVDQVDPIDPASTSVMNTLTARAGLLITMGF